MSIETQNLGQVAPLSVGSGYLNLNKDNVNKMCEVIEAQYKESFDSYYIGEDKSWAGDAEGYAILHKLPEFEQFFLAVGDACRKYCNDIGINNTKFDYHVARSWGTRSVAGQNISPHSHSYCHLSLVYYLTAPENCGHLVLSSDNPANEIIPGLFCEEAYENGYISYTNPNSLYSIAYEPKPDLYTVFPAKTFHHTAQCKSEENRYSIAVDIVMTLKDSDTMELGLPSQAEWGSL